MNIQIGQKALITCSNWFYAPDGSQYRAVYGTVKAIRNDEETLGIKTNRGSSNWYVEIGNMTIAGCQINYAIRTDKCNVDSAFDHHVTEGVTKNFVRPAHIYNAGD